jgi:uncharacterized protein YutE (UPF0331/DUF86 family)
MNDGPDRELLHRMTLSIAGVRPRVIDGKTAERLDELRAFRHVFRNMYRKNLDSERLLLLQKRLPEMVSSWQTAIRAFIELLKAI